ncbi:hypothetical protein L2E82_29898 [Cichorium intybus]|uniref:Uncharacterized protein n=1 Tax=Cichorium intybus TaxID=13427 RepID=A0ACB9CYT0_CICIN|nr:hypothetical protein L2E82_29898 [Cichorium intybus]
MAARLIRALNRAEGKVDIAYQCISFKLKERPTIDKVIERIEEALRIQITSEHSGSTPIDQQMGAGDIHLHANINDDNRVAIAQAEAIPLLTHLPDIVHVLKEGSMEARENAATTLFNLSLIDENKETIGSAGAIPPLLLLLSQGTQRGKRDASIALYNLFIHHDNTLKALEAGVVPMMMEFLREPQGELCW